jgi:hypothetical protein
MPYEPFAPQPNERPEQLVRRLRKLIANGQDRLIPALAEALVQSAQVFASEGKFGDAVTRVDESLQILRVLVHEEHQLELNTAIGRCLLFRAAVMRFHSGPEDSVKAFNEAIEFFTTSCDLSNPEYQNELAVALMNKADILSDPLGAYSAAIAAQDQAVRIWQRLVNTGHPIYRQPMVTSLLSLGDSKVQSGDEQSAVADFQRAAEITAEDIDDADEVGGTSAVANGDNLLPLHLQSLYKLSKLYDRLGETGKAFAAVREAIRTADKIIASNTEEAQVILTSLYLHLGTLCERTHDADLALEAYNRCRDVYHDVMKITAGWDAAQTFMLRNGYANVLMCRGNVLAEMRKFKEAATAYQESVRAYQEASEIKPPDHDDQTLMPYSIGVVMLNHANMLTVMGLIGEAVEMQKQAMAMLQLRIAAGHHEVIPNMISAYRKMINIRSFQGNQQEASSCLDSMITLLEQAVDDGLFEFRTDLAASYRHRAILSEEREDYAAAEKNLLQSVNVFRNIADDDTDKPEVHFSKVQWSDALQHLAITLIRQQKILEAVETMHKAVADIVSFYHEGNEHVCIDVLLAYSQFVEMVDGLLRSSSFSDRALKEPELPDEIRQRLERLQTLGASESEPEQLPQGVTELSPDDFQRWLDEAFEYCDAGSALSLQKKDDHKRDLTARLFFEMKHVYFTKMHGALLHLAKRDAEASSFFETAAKGYLVLIESINNLKAKDKYYAAENGEPVPDWDIPGSGSDDPYMDRFVYYANEYRQTMQFWAYSQLSLGNALEAEKLYEQENLFSWELVKRGVPNADRLLVNSLSARANSTAEQADFETVNSLYTQALELLRMRLSSGDTNWEDYFFSKNVHRSYALFLHHKDKTEIAQRVLGEFAGFLAGLIESVKDCPPAGLWLSICKMFDVNEVWCDTKQMKGIRKIQKRLLTQYPGYDSEPELRDYAETLDKEIEN